MGVSKNAKKGMKKGKEIARVKISSTFQLIWIAAFPTPTPSKNNRHGCLKVILSLKPQVLWLSAPQTAALFTLPKWCIKMCHSVMAVLDCATTHTSIGTNTLQGSQMWHSTQKIQLKCFFLLAVLTRDKRKKRIKTTVENNEPYYWWKYCKYLFPRQISVFNNSWQLLLRKVLFSVIQKKDEACK